MNVTKVVLASRPGNDKPPNYSNFEVKHEIKDFCLSENENQVLVKALFLSVDPASRLESVQDQDFRHGIEKKCILIQELATKD